MAEAMLTNYLLLLPLLSLFPPLSVLSLTGYQEKELLGKLGDRIPKYNLPFASENDLQVNITFEFAEDFDYGNAKVSIVYSLRYSSTTNASWNPEDYEDVSVLNVGPEFFWQPTLGLFAYVE